MAPVVVPVRVGDREQDRATAHERSRSVRAVTRDRVLAVGRRVPDVEEPVAGVSRIEGETEEAALAAEVDFAPEIEKDPSRTTAKAHDASALLDDVASLRLTRRERQEHWSLKAAREDDRPERALGARRGGSAA